MRTVYYITTSILMAILYCAIALVSALVTQLLWNTIAYSDFHQPQVSYYQALVLDILAGVYALVSSKEKK